MDFEQAKVPELKAFLQDRGITCHIYKKQDLVRLCRLAAELKLEVLRSNESDYVAHDIMRRTVKNKEGEEVVVKEISAINSWCSNLKSLPDIESYDVMIYLCQVCGWNDSRLRNYRNDNGYKLFQANHINDVQMCLLENVDYMYVKSKCVPETRQSEDPYNTWVLLSLDGVVKSGGCTCVADDGTCKHCVALMFALSSFIDRHRDRHIETCTDVECQWDKPKKSTCEPMEIEYIDLRKDQSISPPIEATPLHYHPKQVSGLSQQEIERQFYTLCKKENSLLIQILDPPSNESSDHEMVYTPSMREVIGKMSPDVAMNQVEKHLQTTFTHEIRREIELSTRGQSENPEWYTQREGRITASLFSSVMHFRYTPHKPNNYIVKKVMGNGKDCRSASLSFGKDHEPIARQQYFEKMKKVHKCLKVEECGLHIDAQHPYIGASPDGRVTCSCCGSGLIEIKCSFSHQNELPIEVCSDDDYHIYCDEKKRMRLKTSSPWYIQIQGQMGVCDCEWCDFVFYTKKGIAVDRIYFDKMVYSDIVSKCKKFFETYILNALQEE